MKLPIRLLPDSPSQATFLGHVTAAMNSHLDLGLLFLLCLFPACQGDACQGDPSRQLDGEAGASQYSADTPQSDSAHTRGLLAGNIEASNIEASNIEASNIEASNNSVGSSNAPDDSETELGTDGPLDASSGEEESGEGDQGEGDSSSAPSRVQANSDEVNSDETNAGRTSDPGETADSEKGESTTAAEASAELDSDRAVTRDRNDFNERQGKDDVLEKQGESGAGTPVPPETDPTTSSRPPRPWLNLRTRILLGVVLACLAIASGVAYYLSNQSSELVNAALIRRFRQRVYAWWMMCAILVFGLLLQSTGTVVLFGLISFWALREFITMAPTRRGDHRALFWALIVFTPLQYVLIGWDFYGLFSIVIPVYASLYIPARIAISGDHKRFLERSAQITFGLLICVYSLSYAPALVNLDLTDLTGKPWGGSPAGLLFFLILVSQLSDILQWTWGFLVGKSVIAQEISSGRTWEGFAGGTLSTGLIGASLFWVTPFSFWVAAGMSMVIGVMGMFGGMTMSAIKRDRGVNDYGSLVLGHAGVLDRIDTLCFAAPVFYHLTRFFYT